MIRSKSRRSMPRRRHAIVRDGLRAGVLAAVISGAPSTLFAIASGGDPLEATRAAGSILARGESRNRRLLIAALPVHFALSAFWGLVLAATLPRGKPLIAGSGAGLAIAVNDLLIVGRRYPRIRALPLIPQLLDHVAFGIVAALALEGRAGSKRRGPGARKERRDHPALLR